MTTMTPSWEPAFIAMLRPPRDLPATVVRVHFQAEVAAGLVPPPTTSWPRRQRRLPRSVRAYRSRAMTAARLFAMAATGVTSFRLTTKLEFAIAAMHFIVGGATRWISARIAARLFVIHVPRS